MTDLPFIPATPEQKLLLIAWKAQIIEQERKRALGKPLGPCPACGEGKVYPRVSVHKLKSGAKFPMLMQHCDTCNGDYAGHLESAANVAVVAAIRAQEQK